MGMVACTLIAADAKDEVKSAAKKLAGNAYSWKSTTQLGNDAGGGRFRPGPTEGKIAKDGAVQLAMTFNDNTTEAVVKGEKGALKTQDGWRSFAELSDQGGGQNRGAFMVRRLQNYKAPAAEIEDLVTKVKELKKTDDAVGGDLTDEGVKQYLLMRGRAGGQGPEVKDGKGSVKIWIKNGELSKYELKVQGKMTFNDQEMDINRTTTTEIKDVGTTKVEIPEEAKSKLQ
jgi:hypothetical protein